MIWRKKALSHLELFLWVQASAKANVVGYGHVCCALVRMLSWSGEVLSIGKAKKRKRLEGPVLF